MDDSAEVWLVRLPSYLYSHLVKEARDGQEGALVGSLSGPPAALRLELAPHDALQGKATVLESRQQPLNQQDLKAFVEDSQGSLDVVGTVTFRANFMPQAGSEYSAMIQQKNVKAETKTAKTQVQSGAGTALDLKRRLRDDRKASMKRLREAAPEQRHEMTHDEMVILFALFFLLSLLPHTTVFFLGNGHFQAV